MDGLIGGWGTAGGGSRRQFFWDREKKNFPVAVITTCDELLDSHVVSF